MPKPATRKQCKARLMMSFHVRSKMEGATLSCGTNPWLSRLDDLVLLISTDITDNQQCW